MKKISKIIKIIFFFNALFLLISCTQPNTDTDSQINVKYTTTLGLFIGAPAIKERMYLPSL